MLLTSVVLSGLVWEFGFTSRTRNDLDLLTEAQQGVRAAVSAVTQELRQAGACLPRTGDLVALAGNNDGVHDELTLRIGKVREEDLVCIRTVLTNAADAGDTVLVVQSTSGFEAGSLLLIRGDSGTGESFGVVNVGSSTITLDGSVSVDYASGAGVFAIEERTYTVDASSNPPVLTLAIDGDDPQPLVHGVEGFNVKYITTPCPPCDEINEPADDDEWLTVREVAIEFTVRSRERNRAGDYIRLTSRTNVKPRNLL
jgi:hypothetical protein